MAHQVPVHTNIITNHALNFYALNRTVGRVLAEQVKFKFQVPRRLCPKDLVSTECSLSNQEPEPTQGATSGTLVDSNLQTSLEEPLFD